MNLSYKSIIVLIPFFTTIFSYGQDSSKMTVEDSIKTKYVRYPVKYPKKAKENGISGTVIVTYDIDSTCSFVNRTIKEGLGYGCDEAALAVLDKIEKDIKRDNKSKCKPFSMTMPIRFIMK